MSLSDQSRLMPFVVFALASLVWAWLGPLGWPLALAFTVTAIIWTWLVRRDFTGQSMVQRIRLFSALWFALGATLACACWLGLKLRGLV